MRLWIFIIFISTVGCGHFQGPGEYKSQGEYRSPAYVANGEGSSSAYVPSARGKSKGYRPQHNFALSWPLDAVKLSQPFRPVKKRRPHLGIDLTGAKGTPIKAAHEGLVIYAGRGFKGFGRLVIVEYDDQWASLYAHLDKILVKQGQVVSRGEVVGKMGRSGRATGVHLHFELLHEQRPIDPLPLLSEGQRIVDSGNR